MPEGKDESFFAAEFELHLMTFLFLLSTLFLTSKTKAEPDTLKQGLQGVEVVTSRKALQALPGVYGVQVLMGRTAEAVRPLASGADLSTQNTRQVYARLAGLTIWENEGSGLQTNLSSRGLSPNRSWEFQVRQNGVDVAAEAFGYPEAYYAPPLEAVGQVEVLRGAASLAFGPQVGGVLHYRLREPWGAKPFSAEIRQTAGSYGLWNSYSQVSWQKGRFKIWGFWHNRQADGWRQNSRYSTYTGYLQARFALSRVWTVGAELTRQRFESQQSGGLTDAAYHANSRQSFRQRNWLEVPWTLAQLWVERRDTIGWQIDLRGFATTGERNSVGITSAANVPDTAMSGKHPRQVDRDAYRNLGIEFRALKRMGRWGVFTAGVRAYRGHTWRRQKGAGTGGSDLDLTTALERNGDPFLRDLVYQTANLSAYVEHAFRLGKRLTLVPGVRWEHIQNTASGRYAADAASGIDLSRTRNLLLAGFSTEFALTRHQKLFANATQGFRPATFSELSPVASTEQVDPGLRDAGSVQAELGWKANVGGNLEVQATTFILYYQNKIGSIVRQGVLWKTNIGDARHRGVELQANANVLGLLGCGKGQFQAELFGAFGYVEATYVRWNTASGNLGGNRVEYAPRRTLRAGTDLRWKTAALHVQATSVGGVFTDAANTYTPNAAATVGWLPGYTVWDAQLSLVVYKGIRLNGGVNNLFDAHYATRRATGYPGPGVLPGMGRTLYAGLVMQW